MVHFQPDTSMCSMNGSVGKRMVSFMVLGDPVPQARLKFVRGKYIDPSGRLKGEFSACASVILRHMGILIRPLFPVNIQVGVRLVYVLSRPNFHFQGGNRSNDLKPMFASRHIAYNNRQGDVDNYVKFNLDAISSETILTDDRQIIYIESIKMFEEWNEGSYTFIEVYEWNKDKTLLYAPPKPGQA